MKRLLILIALFPLLAWAQTPGSFEWKYQKGYLTNAEIKENLCCPCDDARLDKLIWYSAKKGVTQRVDRQNFVIGKWDGGYAPLTDGDIATLVAGVPARPVYPAILNDPEMWRYPREVIDKVINDYHAALESWVQKQQEFAVYIDETFVVYRAHWVVSACDQYKIGTKACIWLPYEGDLKQAYLNSLYATLSGAFTSLQNMATKVRTPINIKP
jgi:hypothetical protein